jgi:hypothetical protein
VPGGLIQWHGAEANLFGGNTILLSKANNMNICRSRFPEPCRFIDNSAFLPRHCHVIKINESKNLLFVITSLRIAVLNPAFAPEPKTPEY